MFTANACHCVYGSRQNLIRYHLPFSGTGTLALFSANVLGTLGPASHRIIVSNAPESIANLSPSEPLIPPESQVHAVSEPEHPTDGQPKTWSRSRMSLLKTLCKPKHRPTEFVLPTEQPLERAACRCIMHTDGQHP
jgi:hypothetical protein